MAIEKIRAGDLVMAADENGNRGLKRVVRTFARQTESIVTVNAGEMAVRCTPEHPFFVEGKGFVYAADLEPGNILVTEAGGCVMVTSVEADDSVNADNTVTVYNLEVENWHTYFVGEDGVLVHNTCPTTDIPDKIIRDGSQLENGKLKPNVTYQTGEFEYTYKTDAEGRICKWSTDDLKLTDRDTRLKHDSKTPGKISGDHAGHLAGDRFGGSNKIDNLISQDSHVNLSDYRKIENQWADAIEAGKTVTTDVTIRYDNGGTRPSGFDIKYTIGNESFHKIINN